jgi:hypothetical protein
MTARLRWQPLRKCDPVRTRMVIIGVIHAPVWCDPSIDVAGLGRDQTQHKHQEYG